MLTYTSLDAAEKLLKNLPEKIRQLEIPNAPASTGPFVTCSVGLTGTVPMDNLDIDALLRSADSLAYQAKSAGRNSLCAGPVVFSHTGSEGAHPKQKLNA